VAEPEAENEAGAGTAGGGSAEDLLLVGRVARAHGNRGQVIVNPETDFPEQRFRVGTVLLVGPAGKPAPRRIESARFHQGRPVIALEGIASMNDAEALAGAELWMPASALPPLPGGTFYRHDLVGCEVRDVSNALVGQVADVHGPIERSHLVVEGPHGEVLVPLVERICVRIDTANRVIVIDPPEGLLEANLRQRAETPSVD
jgi:16S rRNA processing protein RimM